MTPKVQDHGRRPLLPNVVAIARTFKRTSAFNQELGSSEGAFGDAQVKDNFKHMASARFAATVAPDEAFLKTFKDSSNEDSGAQPCNQMEDATASIDPEAMVDDQLDLDFGRPSTVPPTPKQRAAVETAAEPSGRPSKAAKQASPAKEVAARSEATMAEEGVMLALSACSPGSEQHSGANTRVRTVSPVARPRRWWT